jgi:hypothetical protein
MLPEVYFKPPEAANSRAHQGCIPTRTNCTRYPGKQLLAGPSHNKQIGNNNDKRFERWNKKPR